MKDLPCWTAEPGAFDEAMPCLGDNIGDKPCFYRHCNGLLVGVEVRFCGSSYKQDSAAGGAGDAVEQCPEAFFVCKYTSMILVVLFALLCPMIIDLIHHRIPLTKIWSADQSP